MSQLSLLGIEIWKPIPGFCDRYEASSEGRIRRREGAAWKKRVWRDLYPKVSIDKKTGYTRTRIMRDVKRSYNVGVHQLVALAFIGPCPDGKEVNHIDLDKSNNRPENLEYITHAENIRHVRGRKSWQTDGNRKLDETKVREIRLLLAQGLTHKQIGLAYGVSGVAITYIRTGKTWTKVKD